MKLESIKTNTTETFLEGQGITVSVYKWGNLEGCSFLVHGAGEGSPIQLAGSFRWEELDVIISALTIARTE